MEVFLVVHTSVCLSYCRKEDIPLDGVNIPADCSPEYEDVEYYTPPSSQSSVIDEVVGVNLESCPAYTSATEEAGGVNLELCPAYTSATEEVGGYLELLPSDTSSVPDSTTISDRYSNINY